MCIHGKISYRSGVRQTLIKCHSRRNLLDDDLSAPEALSVLSADVVQTNNLLRQMNVISKVAWAAEVGEDVDDVLLLAQEFRGQCLTSLLAKLFSRQLDNLWPLLGNIVCGSLSLAADRLALRLAMHRR
jgi:hypothetical protein